MLLLSSLWSALAYLPFLHWVCSGQLSVDQIFWLRSIDYRNKRLPSVSFYVFFVCVCYYSNMAATEARLSRQDGDRQHARRWDAKARAGRAHRVTVCVFPWTRPPVLTAGQRHTLRTQCISLLLASLHMPRQRLQYLAGRTCSTPMRAAPSTGYAYYSLPGPEVRGHSWKALQQRNGRLRS
jgi:hypothetical protein